jgi:hypothetical protein
VRGYFSGSLRISACVSLANVLVFGSACQFRGLYNMKWLIFFRPDSHQRTQCRRDGWVCRNSSHGKLRGTKREDFHSMSLSWLRLAAQNGRTGGRPWRDPIGSMLKKAPCSTSVGQVPHDRIEDQKISCDGCELASSPSDFGHQSQVQTQQSMWTMTSIWAQRGHISKRSSVPVVALSRVHLGRAGMAINSVISGCIIQAQWSARACFRRMCV